MSNQPLLSVLVVNFNNGHYLVDCYKSLLAQTYQNFEVIIVDDYSTDYSTDDSLEIIKNTIKDDSRFKIFQNEVNKGAGFTKAKCVSIAHAITIEDLDYSRNILLDFFNTNRNRKKLQSSIAIIKKDLQLCMYQ